MGCSARPRSWPADVWRIIPRMYDSARVYPWFLNGRRAILPVLRRDPESEEAKLAERGVHVELSGNDRGLGSLLPQSGPPPAATSPQKLRATHGRARRLPA
jgi:hypothetical protein